MSPWERLLLLTALVYLAFKAATVRGLRPAAAAAYVALWPGMEPRPFLRREAPEGTGLMAWGALKMAFGAVLLLFRTGVTAVDLVFVFLGIGFLVHLGLCDALAGFWRSRGVAVERLFPNPAASRSLAEFWGRRWNRAFHAVAHGKIFRPVARRRGVGWGLAATFLFSGLLHDLLISVSAGSGYGLPTLYFALQGSLVGAERRWGMKGRLWTWGAIVIPLPLLFHPGFIREVLLPLV